jgi:hypothetical protein
MASTSETGHGLAFKESRNRNIAGWKNRSGTRKKSGHHIT